MFNQQYGPTLCCHLFSADGTQLKCSLLHTAFTFSFSSTGLMLSGANWFGFVALPAVGVTDLDIGAISTDIHWTNTRLCVRQEPQHVNVRIIIWTEYFSHGKDLSEGI